MTLSEVQTLRAAAMASLTSLLSSPIKSYNAMGTQVTKFEMEQLQARIDHYDIVIQRLSGTGGVGVAQFRCSE